MQLKSVVVAEVQGKSLSLHELLHTLKLRGQLRRLLADALGDKVIANAIETQKIAVGDEELQTAANSFRNSTGLNKAADTERWLALNRLSPRDLEVALEQGLARKKLMEKVITDQVSKFFEDNRASFDRARLAHLVLDKEGPAQEILTQLREDGLDFAEAARRHSLDEASKHRGGSLGLLSRKQLPPAVEAAVFSAKPGDVVGPFALNNRFCLLKVEEIRPGQLDARTTAFIQRRLFRTWVRDQVRQGNVQVRLFDYL